MNLDIITGHVSWTSTHINKERKNRKLKQKANASNKSSEVQRATMLKGKMWRKPKIIIFTMHMKKHSSSQSFSRCMVWEELVVNSLISIRETFSFYFFNPQEYLRSPERDA